MKWPSSLKTRHFYLLESDYALILRCRIPITIGYFYLQFSQTTFNEIAKIVPSRKSLCEFSQRRGARRTRGKAYIVRNKRDILNKEVTVSSYEDMLTQWYIQTQRSGLPVFTTAGCIESAFAPVIASRVNLWAARPDMYLRCKYILRAYEGVIKMQLRKKRPHRTRDNK